MGRNLDRAKALNVLRIIQDYGGNPAFIELRKIQYDSYELHYKPTILNVETLKHIAETHGLRFSEDSGKVIFF